MKKIPAYYYAFSSEFIVFTQPAYDKLKPFIESGVASRHNDLIYLQKMCHELIPNTVDIFRNEKTVNEKDACFSCVHRVRKVTGVCNHRYQSLKTEQYADFTYLLDKCQELSISENKELMSYVRLLDYPDENIDEQLGDMTYKEYQALLSFFHRLDTAMETLLSVKRFFAKIFR